LANPSVYELVDRVGSIPFSGTVFRHIASHRSCTSGEGARQAGGRWNPPDSFPVLYTGLTEETTIEEFYRLADRSSLPVQSFLPRTICVLGAELTAVLDLRDDANLALVGLSLGQVRADPTEACRLVGEASHKLGHEGILAPSATGLGEILAIFELNLRNNSRVYERERREWSAST